MRKLLLLTLSLFVVVGGCRKKAAATPATGSAAPPNEIQLPAPNPALSPQQQAEEALGSMNEALRSYMAAKGKMPASIDELYSGYAPKGLQPPPGKRFVLNPKLMGVEYR